MKKFLKVLLIVFISILIISCKKYNKEETKPKESTAPVVTEPTVVDSKTTEPTIVTPTPTPTPTPTIVDEDVVVLKYDFSDSRNNISNAIKNYDFSYNPTLGEKYKEEILNILSNELGYSELETAISEFENHNKEIMDLLTIVETLSYAFYESDDAQQYYNDLYAYYLDLDTLWMELEVEIAKSVYASEYFTYLTPEEIEELANKEIDNEELNNCLVRKNEISSIYYSVDNPEELLAEFVELNKRIAELNGYGRYGYTTYSDECVYNRRYKSEDIQKLSEYILKYYYSLKDYFYRNRFYTTDVDEKKKVSHYSNDTILECRDIFDEYVDAVGGTYKECYYDLWDNGYYCFADSGDCYPTAFQDKYYDLVTLYMGSYYNTMGTFVHEFGHYHTAIYDHDYFSYDVLETHSQGSEALLRLYLLEKYPSYSSSAFEGDLISSLVYTIVAGEMIREYEETLYSSEVDDIKGLWESIIERYGYTGWYGNEGMIIFYDNYYFSYATSAISALLFYAYGKEHGFEETKDLYLEFCNYEGDGDLIEALESIGFMNPFEEETNEYICSIISDTIKNEWKDYVSYHYVD